MLVACTAALSFLSIGLCILILYARTNKDSEFLKMRGYAIEWGFVESWAMFFVVIVNAVRVVFDIASGSLFNAALSALCAVLWYSMDKDNFHDRWKEFFGSWNK